MHIHRRDQRVYVLHRGPWQLPLQDLRLNAMHVPLYDLFVLPQGYESYASDNGHPVQYTPVSYALTF